MFSPVENQKQTRGIIDPPHSFKLLREIQNPGQQQSNKYGQPLDLTAYTIVFTNFVVKNGLLPVKKSPTDHRGELSTAKAPIMAGTLLAPVTTKYRIEGPR